VFAFVSSGSAAAEYPAAPIPAANPLQLAGAPPTGAPVIVNV
jgi:hypothetical protein